ncbi:FecR family protein [Chitinophaga sp. 30R24]|uniref:FecR family protein n=1 Tax=Chitinophaga sp. 30R24 TaxID=3248838 RepID=UPI003B9189AE
MQKEEAQELLKRYREGLCTREEKKKIETWFRHVQQTTNWKVPEEENTATRDRMYDRIVQQIDVLETVPLKVAFIRRYRWKIAAAVLLLIGIGNVILWQLRPVQHQVIANNPAAQLPPGTTGAMLTLSNGQQILLDSTNNGVLATQGDAKIIKDNGQVAYQASAQTQEAVYNTITTPVGRTFKVVLPDSTQVWLNAASSITYPTAFTGKERMVSINGEAYFTVAHRAKQPFRVKAGKEIIEDLGTSFNVNVYPDEPSQKITLVEGAIKVRLQQLKPAEQAIIALSGAMTLLEDVEVENVVAWKNGNFHFNSVDIYTIMRQVARWYNIKVEYQASVDETFSGGISRSANLSELLHILETTGKIHFEIKDRTIIIQS